MSTTIATVNFYNNTIYDSGYGIELYNDAPVGIGGIVVSGNTVYNSGKSWSGKQGGLGDAGIVVYTSRGSFTNLLLSQNTVYGNAGDGLYLGDQCGNVAVSSNFFYGNGGAGMKVESEANPSTTGITAAYNTIASNLGTGFYYDAWFAQGFAVYNNTFYNNGGDASSTYNIYIAGFHGSKLIKNNILYGVNSMSFYDVNGLWNGPSTDYNAYYRQSASLLYFGGLPAIYTVSEFSRYQSITGQDSHSISADPMFTNGSGSYNLPSDFALQPGSPAIGRGVYITGAAVTPPNVGAN
jgi:hypothetical protein